MPNYLIKNVPEESYEVLQQLATANGQSLEEFVLEILVKLTESPV